MPSNHGKHTRKTIGAHRLIIFMTVLMLLTPGAGNLSAAPGAPPAEKVLFAADDPRIVYLGRIDFSDPKAPRFDWPGVSISAVFEGSYCGIVLADGRNDYNVFVDGQPFAVIATTADTELYEDVSGLARGVHTLLLTKRTEGYFGVGTFKGLFLEKGRKLLAPPKASAHKIEFIGDSITCGYGNEGKSVTCSSLREFQNNYLAYGAVAARELKADYHVIAVSGKGVVRNYGDKNQTSAEPMPAYYDRVLQNDVGLKWNPRSWVPRVVVINLGANDFSTQPQADKDLFLAEYLKLVKRVRTDYANAEIFCLSGTNAVFPQNETVREAVEKCNAAGDDKVHFVRTPSFGQIDCGCDWHPNTDAHKRIAEVLVGEIRRYVK